jgi:hypothetical protein
MKVYLIPENKISEVLPFVPVLDADGNHILAIRPELSEMGFEEIEFKKIETA